MPDPAPRFVRPTAEDGGERGRLGSPVDAQTRLFAIIGDPIDHVRAPVVWSALFGRFGINAVFLPAHVEAAGFDAAIRGLKALRNVDGLMFTMPHKAAAMRHADTLTERARRVGSLNLLRPDPDGSWTGDNVDGAGFIAGLHADGIRLDGVHAYVHGAGGVGRNIAWSLAAEPIASLVIFDIDAGRAGELAAHIAAECLVPVTAGAIDALRCGLAVNASPLGLDAGDPLPFTVDALPAGAVVADVVMEPMMTALLGAAAARGLKVHHGRNMMNHAMPLAARFFRLPEAHDWNGGALQNTGWAAIAGGSG